MQTLDLKTDLKYLYLPSAKQVEVVDVPALQFAMIDGAIEKDHAPGTSPGFAAATQALYSTSYTLKFAFKKRPLDPIDYPVMALEGLWWVPDGSFAISIADNWLYTLMILQPDVVTRDAFEDARSEVRRKRGPSEALDSLRLETFTEGLSVQVMHVGPYATEPATVARLTSFAEEHGYTDLVALGGKHHEIYLGDPRRTSPERLRTVVRHPIRKA